MSADCPESNGKVERSHRTDEEEFHRQVIYQQWPRSPRTVEHE